VVITEVASRYGPDARTSSNAPDAAISLEHVTKRYRRGGGITDLSLAVAPGEVFGFLGPNGAGKTTTIRLLLDLIRPDTGRVTVLGLDARRDSVEVRRRVGYLPGELALYERLTARELLVHFAFLRGRLPWAPIEGLAERFELELDRPISELSRGNKQKVGVVQAFMGTPELLVLDEPTSGLDPLVQREVHAAIEEVSAAGRTVMLSSHILSEVSRVAHRVGIIRAGRLVATEDVALLRSRALHRLEARLGAPVPPNAFAEVPGVLGCEVEGSVVRLRLAGEVDAVVKALARFEVIELTVHEPDLEEVFLNFYEGPER
jgi:ABC-2 type transport system ATP-binding protein